MAETTQARRARRDDDASEQGEPTPNGSRGTAATWAGAAVAAMVLGGVGGAMKALYDRRSDEPATENQDSDPQATEQQDADAQDSGARDTGAREIGARDTDAQDADAEDAEDADAEDADAQATDAQESEPEAREDGDTDGDEPAEPEARERDDETDETDEDDTMSPPEDKPEPAPERRPEPARAAPRGKQNRPRGASGDEAAAVVTEARRQLTTLLGSEPERVSGLERVDGGWSVELEVVEVARVPESTDVLATYELTLDDDVRLVAAHRTRRYRRSQIDEA